MNQSELTAYAAGLLDARGVFVIGVSKYSRGLASHWLQVSIRSAERAPLELLKSKFEGEITGTAKAPKSGWIWRVLAHDALAFLLRVRPILLAKHRHADIAIAFQTEKKDLGEMTVVERHTELARRAGQKIMLQQLTRRRKVARVPDPTRATAQRFPGSRF